MKDNVYLDNAATTWPKPEAVHAFADRFVRARGVNPGRGGHAMAADADRMVMQARRLLGACFGFSGGASRVVFAHNGTDALGTAIRGLVRPGDRLVTTRLEHNAVARTLAHLERDANLAVERVAADARGYVPVEAVARALEGGARALVVNHASNVIGTVQPLVEIADVARERGVALVVDAAQTAGVLPIDVDALGIAALAFPGHKGLFGPTGSGGLIVAPGVELRPSRVGGTGVDSASVYQPGALPFRLEAGTLGLPGIAGLHAAQRWLHALGAHLEDDPAGSDAVAFVPDAAFGIAGVPDGAPDPCGIGARGQGIEALLDEVDGIDPAVHARRVRAAMARIHAVELAHVRRIEAELARYPAVRVLGDGANGERVATLSFTVEGREATEIAERLDADFGVCSRAGLQCAPAVHEALGTLDAGGTVRLSPGWYTDEEDLARLFEGLADVL